MGQVCKVHKGNKVVTHNHQVDYSIRCALYLFGDLEGERMYAFVTSNVSKISVTFFFSLNIRHCIHLLDCFKYQFNFI